MEIRKIQAALGSAIFIGAFGLAQAGTTAPAVAAPAAVVADQAHSASIGTSPDFRRGYRDGFRDGWKSARKECKSMSHSTFSLHGSQSEDDYMRGYNKGFDKGFSEGFEEYCGDDDDWTLHHRQD
jgi:hypothetical protein